MEKIIYRQCGKDDMYKVWHTSKNHLIMYINSGNGSIVGAEKIFPLKARMLVFIAADTYHYTMPEIPDDYERSKLIISPKKFSAVGDSLQKSEIFHFFENSIVCAEIKECDCDTVEGIFADFKKYENDEANEWMFLSCLLQLLFFLNKYMTESAAISPGGMDAAIKYINENISSKLDIDNICDNIHISKYYFCRQFKNRVGMTVMKYILKTRIVLAKSELKKTDLPITEISEKLGFSSVSYFCRAFKEEEGCSPFKYRKNTLNKI